MNPFDRLICVEQEYLATRQSLARFVHLVESNPTVLAGSPVEPGHVRRALASCEKTYLVRVFAEFEAILREFWRESLHRRTRPDMGPLITAIAARRNAPDQEIMHLHEVRNYRNTIVHPGAVAAPLTWQQCRSRLAQFLSHLPYRWLYSP